MGKKKTPTKQAPLAVEALAVCDMVSRDPNTGKATLYGLFDKITPLTFPASGSFWIYAKFVGSGEHTVELDVLDERGVTAINQKAIASLKFDSDGKAVLIVKLDEMRFVRPGEYTVAFRSGRRALGRPLKIIAEKRRVGK